MWTQDVCTLFNLVTMFYTGTISIFNTVPKCVFLVVVPHGCVPNEENKLCKLLFRLNRNSECVLLDKFRVITWVFSYLPLVSSLVWLNSEHSVTYLLFSFLGDHPKPVSNHAQHSSKVRQTHKDPEPNHRLVVVQILGTLWPACRSKYKTRGFYKFVASFRVTPHA